MSTWRQLKKNPSLWQRYFIREKVIKGTRNFFDTEGFHEVETPLLITHPPAESYLEVFETTLLDRNRTPHKAYLSTSPEVALKKLMVAGIGNCYAITKSFRNTETHSALHNPEFTILEWYRVNVDYLEIMKDVEALLLELHSVTHPRNKNRLTYQGQDVDLTPPWDRLTVTEAFEKYSHIDFLKFLDLEHAVTIAKKKGYVVTPNTTWEELYNQIFLNEIESNLGRGKPTILYEFPGSMGALARRKPSDARFAERFEFYIAGLELGDCYSELTDWREQQIRFEKEITEIKRLGKTTYEYDHDFIEALKSGLPPSSGIAVGLDRIIMLLANVKTIHEILLFPTDERLE